MLKPHGFTVPKDLRMPLRDALRGVATLADATDEALEPAAKLLPEPFRSRFLDALDSIEQAGKRLMTAPIDQAQIGSASQFLTAADTGRDSAHACALAIVFGWEHLNEASVSHRHLISETIVADILSRKSDESNLIGADFAAAVFADIRASSAIGRMPGLARGITAGEEGEVDLALLSIAVWLLSSRADSMAEEEKLLDLSIALVRALREDASNTFGDRSRLARFLSDTSAHL